MMTGGWLVMAGVVCLTLGPALGQITFSRSWVPQGKRSGGTPALTPDLTPEAYREVRLATLNQVAAQLAELIEEAASDPSSEDSALALRLKQAMVARRRRMT